MSFTAVCCKLGLGAVEYHIKQKRKEILHNGNESAEEQVIKIQKYKETSESQD